MVAAVCAQISDAAIREAFKKAYFPGGLKLSQFEDVGFFTEGHAMNFEFEPHPESDSDSDLGMAPSSDGSSSDEDSDSDSDSDPESDSQSTSGGDSEVAPAKRAKNDEVVDIVWAKADRGICGLGHVFNGKL